MHREIKAVLAALCGILLLAPITSAAPLPAPPFNTAFLQFNQDYWTLTDVDGNADDATFVLALENAGYESDFGLYMVSPDSAALTRFQVFSYLQEPSSVASVYFKNISGNWNVSLGNSGKWVPFSNEFGFYFGVHTGGRPDPGADYLVYTDKQYNPDQMEFIGTWWSAPNIGYIFLDDQWKRLAGMDDNDYDDMILMGIDIKPVPEPAAMFVFGSGLLGLFALTRKQYLR